MSEANPFATIDANPLSTAFEFQRSALEQTHSATVEAVEAQKTAVNAAADSVDTFQEIAEQSTQFSQEAVHAYLDSIEQLNPEADLDELRDLVDDGFESAEEFQDESWEAVKETIDESVDGFEAAADNYTEMVDSSFDTYLQAHEQVEEGVEELEDVDPTPN